MDVVREVIEFIRGKGKALQKAKVAPSGQAGHVEWKWEVERDEALCYKVFFKRSPCKHSNGIGL
jgi:hypothetical protein